MVLVSLVSCWVLHMVLVPCPWKSNHPSLLGKNSFIGCRLFAIAFRSSSKFIGIHVRRRPMPTSPDWMEGQVLWSILQLNIYMTSEYPSDLSKV